MIIKTNEQIALELTRRIIPLGIGMEFHIECPKKRVKIILKFDEIYKLILKKINKKIKI